MFIFRNIKFWPFSIRWDSRQFTNHAVHGGWILTLKPGPTKGPSSRDHGVAFDSSVPQAHWCSMGFCSTRQDKIRMKITHLLEIQSGLIFRFFLISFSKCAMEENCLASEAYRLKKDHPGWATETRRLLRFTTSIANVGNADFKPFIPKEHWEWHSCHMHYHSMEVLVICPTNVSPISEHPNPSIPVFEPHKIPQFNGCSGSEMLICLVTRLHFYIGSVLRPRPHQQNIVLCRKCVK